MPARVLGPEAKLEMKQQKRERTSVAAESNRGRKKLKVCRGASCGIGVVLLKELGAVQ